MRKKSTIHRCYVTTWYSRCYTMVLYIMKKYIRACNIVIIIIMITTHLYVEGIQMANIILEYNNNIGEPMWCRRPNEHS